jgi:uncharacterized protein (TIGR00369 family)
MADVPFGVQALKEQYAREAEIGMIGNLGARIVEVDAGKLVIEADLSDSRHGFPSGRGPIVHGGAIATLADEALASVASTLAKEGETTTTSNLQVDYYRPAMPGRLIARASVRHRSRRLAYCQATVEQADGLVVAECRAVIAYVKA